MDLIAALRTFLRVAEVGSFSAVAEERGVTQPAVSRQVTALEEHFATRLVQRSTHAVTLTEEGRGLMPPPSSSSTPPTRCKNKPAAVAASRWVACA